MSSFSEKQKKEILARDDYRCAMCGIGLKDGFELQVKFIANR